MSTQLTAQQLRDLTQHQNSMKPKPTPEEMINLCLVDDRKENALSFIQWLKDNKLSPTWNTANQWRSNYKSKHKICFVALCGRYGRFSDISAEKDIIGSWRIRLKFDRNAQYAEKDFFSEKVEKVIQDSINRCGYLEKRLPNRCMACPGPNPWNVYNENIGVVCPNHEMISFVNPDAETIEAAKKIILVNRDNIIEAVK